MIPTNLKAMGLMLLMSFGAAEVEAATYVVTKESDDDGPCLVDDCALREAVLAANASPGMDTILLPSGTYVLSIPGPEEDFSMTGDLDVRDDLEIVGDSSRHDVVVVGDGSDRVLTIGVGTVHILNLVVTGGRVLGPAGGVAAINSDVTIEDSSIVGNEVTGTDGGGVFVALGRLTMVNCTVSGNTAARNGGGIFRAGLGFGGEAHLTLINTTVSGNSARRGGGIYSILRGDLEIINSTIAYNDSVNIGDGVFAFESTPPPIWTNSLIVDGCGFFDTFAPLSNGGNIESPGSSCFFPDPTDRMNVPDPGLGPLRDNGGLTRTHALLSGSPAIDTAGDANCPATDQRRLPRPFDGDGDGTATCDVGAVEYHGLLVDIPVLGGPGLALLTLVLSLAALRVLRGRKAESALPSGRS